MLGAGAARGTNRSGDHHSLIDTGKPGPHVTRTTNARIAGFTYLFYIALAFPSMVLFGRATSGTDVAAKLASVAQHASAMRIAIVLTLATCFAAIVLGVTLYAITRDEDPDLAMAALACRVCEGLTSAVFMMPKLELLWLATTAGTNAPDAASSHALGAFLITGTRAWSATVGATFFAVGSTLFTWLLLRGRMIPVTLAWIGLIGSALLVVCLPLQLVAVIGRPMTDLMWLPVAVFELVVAVWFLVNGVRPVRERPTSGA